MTKKRVEKPPETLLATLRREPPEPPEESSLIATDVSPPTLEARVEAREPSVLDITGRLSLGAKNLARSVKHGTMGGVLRWNRVATHLMLATTVAHACALRAQLGGGFLFYVGALVILRMTTRYAERCVMNPRTGDELIFAAHHWRKELIRLRVREQATTRPILIAITEFEAKIQEHQEDPQKDALIEEDELLVEEAKKRIELVRLGIKECIEESRKLTLAAERGGFAFGIGFREGLNSPLARFDLLRMKMIQTEDLVKSIEEDYQRLLDEYTGTREETSAT